MAYDRNQGGTVTSLVVWVAVDQRGPASAYIATDSRVTWPSRLGRWDNARKTYAGPKSPHVFGAVGDVFFSSNALSTILDRLDEADPDATIGEMQDGVVQLLDQAWTGAPNGNLRGDSQIVHCCRYGEGMASEFGVQVLRLASDDSVWTAIRFPMPDASAKIEFLGSGSGRLKHHHGLWIKESKLDKRASTSRAVFSAFCDALIAGDDPATGGAPQLVGLYRKGPAIDFAVRWDNSNFWRGQSNPNVPAKMECRNRYFERVDIDGLLLAGAQRHARSPVDSQGYE